MLHVNSLKLFFLICAFFKLSENFSQNNDTIQILKEELKKTQIDTITINTLNELAWQLRRVDAEKAEQYALKAYNLSDSINNLEKKVISLSRLGTINIYLKNYSKAENIFLDLLKIEKQTNHIYGIGRAYNQLGRIYRMKGKLIKSLEYRLKALKNFKEITDSSQIALVTRNMGDAYKELQEFELAYRYLMKSLDIEIQLGNTRNIYKLKTNLGALCNEMGDYSKALKHFANSENYFMKQNDLYWLSKTYMDIGIAYIGLEKYNEALDYLNKTKKIKTKIKPPDYAGLYNNFGILYAKKEDLDKAQEYFQKSIAEKSNDQESNFLEANVNLADILFKKGKYKEAIQYYEKALDLVGSYEKISVKLKIYYDLSACYSVIKQNDKALKYKNEYVKLNKQINISHIKAIEFEAAYNEKQKENELLKASEKLTKTEVGKLAAENSLKQTKIIALSIGLLITFILFFLIYRTSKLKSRAKIAEKNRQLDAKKIQELLDKEEIRFNQARLDGQEKERIRIAKDLHDRLGSLLSVVKIHYKSVEDQIEKLKLSNKKQYEKANSLLDKACEEVRKIAHDIHSGILAKFGLVAAVEDLATTLNESKQINVEFNAHGIDDRLNNKIEITVYRIIQELVNNILKHAEASEMGIQLLQNEATLTVMVEDNGIGFKYDKENIQGMGLKNVASRVEKLQGELFIDSYINNGTTTTINISLNKI